MLDRFLVRQARKHPGFGRFLTGVVRQAFPNNVIDLEYPINSQPRWSERSPQPFLYELIDRHRVLYQQRLCSFVTFVEKFRAIAAGPDAASPEPTWANGWLPALDSLALYGFLASTGPRRYLEVGSGNSTKFARRAVRDHSLPTEIISIDPHPRAEIDAICDRILRQPAEDVSPEFYDMLEAGDILFIDSSHRVFMNSDVTTLFIDVLPRLKPGVMVQVHDIALPFDYPSEWKDRFYSEQYLLAAILLADGTRFQIELPNAFISEDRALHSLLSPIWALECMRGAQTYGGSFWLKVAPR